MREFHTKRLIESGLMLALASVLSMMKLFQLPYGGAVTVVSMLPMLLLAYRYGVRWGALSCFAYSLVQLLQGMTEGSLKGLTPTAFAGCVLLDYILAFTVLCLGGILRDKLNSDSAAFAGGTVIACLSRYLCHIASGYLFFGDYAEWFFTEAGFPLGEQMMTLFSGKMLALVYSIIYNGTFMLPETVITAVVAAAVMKAAARLLLTDIPRHA